MKASDTKSMDEYFKIIYVHYYMQFRVFNVLKFKIHIFNI